MMKFSQRIGKKPIKIEIQKDLMDKDLRIGLWNCFQLIYLDNVEGEWISRTSYQLFFKSIWFNFFKLPLDNLDDYYKNTYSKIRDWFFKCEWFEVYDFIEFVASIECPSDGEKFKSFCNGILEKELSAYRFVDDFIVEITDENELKEIEEAVNNSNKTKYTGVYEHLKTALSMLSDRKKPDYRNSIKESISAVESLCQVISGDYKAELGKALKILEESTGLHPALKKGFSSIYGYTNDEGGIRHAMIEGNSCDFEDAKYMLVSCSAFINYLKVKCSKVKVSPK